MSDQEFREIQLSGKQLIFLFMSAVVLLVVSFLLGVSVGKGVGSATPLSASAGTAATADTVAVAGKGAETPPADLSYHRELQGQPPVSSEPTPPAAAPPSNPPATTAGAGESPAGTTTGAPPRNPSTGEVPPITPIVTPPPQKAAPPPPAPTPPPAAVSSAEAVPAASASGAFDVQTGAFNSRPNATALVAELKALGYAARLVAGTGTQPRHIVRVGPYVTRAEADRVSATLAKQFKGRITPSVISR